MIFGITIYRFVKTNFHKSWNGILLFVLCYWFCNLSPNVNNFCCSFEMYYVENCFVRMWESFPQNWQKFCNFQSSDSAAVILPKCLRMFVWLGWERKLNILQILRKNADVQINVWTFQLDQHHQQNQHDLPGDVKSENRGGCFPRISELEKLFDKTDLFFTLAFFLFDSLWPF